MRDTPIPTLDVGTLESVAPGIHGLRTVMVNLYSVKAPDNSWVLIDAGLPMTAGWIRGWTEQLHGAGSKPSSILLTHGHFDHVGAVQELAQEWDVPVYAHSLEMPYLTGRSQYPPPDPTVGGGIFTTMSPFYPRGPIDLGQRARILPSDGTVPGLPGWRWIHTPGHTAGHVSFFRDADRVLIVGDAFVTTKQESFLAVASQKPELHGPPAYYTSDWQAAGQSVDRLAGLNPVVAATGHGLPIVGPDVTEQIEALAANFDRWARPETGRYVRQPAVTDERGIVSLPPPATNPVPRALAIAGISAAVFLMIRQARAARRA